MKRAVFRKSYVIPVLGALLMVALAAAWRAAATDYMPIPTLEELMAMSHDELAEQDLATLNLACADGLDGAGQLDKQACLDRLDVWAADISALIKDRRSMYPAYHARTGHSFNQWKCAVIAGYLHNAAGIEYSQQFRAYRPQGYDDTRLYRNAKDLFIGGTIIERKRATCASLPVLFASIGRRLGFPVQLVTTRNHLFARWSDPEETFNIECTDHYAEFKPDEFYRHFPAELNSGEELRMGYLINLTPERTLAAFLHLRGLCLRENRRYAEAKDAFLASIRMNPEYFDPPAQNIFIQMIERDIMIAESEGMRLP